jgi:hypothetical protein
MKKAADAISEKDEWTTFGNFVADNIKLLKPVNQILAKRKITNWLLDMQMNELNTASMSEGQHSLPPMSPVTSDGTYVSDNSNSYQNLTRRSSLSPIPPETNQTFDGLRDFLKTFN